MNALIRAVNRCGNAIADLGFRLAWLAMPVLLVLIVGAMWWFVIWAIGH